MIYKQKLEKIEKLILKLMEISKDPIVKDLREDIKTHGEMMLTIIKE